MAYSWPEDDLAIAADALLFGFARPRDVNHIELRRQMSKVAQTCEAPR